MEWTDSILLAVCAVLLVLNLYLLREVVRGSCASEPFTAKADGVASAAPSTCGYDQRSTWLSNSGGSHCGNAASTPWLYSV